MTLISISLGDDIGLEAIPETGQFLGLEAGDGGVQMGFAKNKLTFEKGMRMAVSEVSLSCRF